LLQELARGLTPPNPTTTVDNTDPVDWITQNFYIPETNAPIRLYPSQQIPLREALRRDGTGNFVYSTIMWSAIKKSAKSSIAAAVGMWFAWRKPYSSVKVYGNDLKQAESRVYEYMRRAVILRADWRDTVRVSRNRMLFPNQSVIEAVPVDPAGEAGSNDDLAIFTELWGWKSSKHKQMWAESTLSPTKYRQSLRWCESYAGYEGESPILYNLYSIGVKQGDVLDQAYEMYVNAPARQFTLWNTTPQLPWQTAEYYAQERASLTPSEFARLHRNQWSNSEEQFVPGAWWDECADVAAVAAAANPVVVALDAAVSGDTFAVVTVTRGVTQRDDERRGIVYVKACRVWEPPRNGKIDFAEVERYLWDLQKQYRIIEFAYDPYQLHDMATRLQGRLGNWRPFAQGQDRLVADKQLYDLIRDGHIRHANDAALNAAIANANRKADGDKLRIVKRTEDLKIDAAVALSMASNRAIYYRIGG
jgi:phage terminase large subunit-like protein